MKPKTIIVLVGVLLACTVYVVVRHGNWGKPKPPGPEAVAEKRVFAADPNGAKALRISWSDGRKIAFARKDGAWRITEPLDAAADSGAVGQVVSALSRLRYERVHAADDKTVGQTSLDSPPAKIALTDEGGASFTLLVGKGVPQMGAAESRTYVRPEGDNRTFVVAVDFDDILRRTPREYRDKTILNLTKDDVVRIKVEGSRSYELCKSSDGWSVVQPVSAPADAAKVGSIIDAFANISAEEFLPESADPAAWGLEKGKEALVLRVWMKATPPATSSAPSTSSAPASQPFAEGKSYALAFSTETTRGDAVCAKFVDQPGIFKVRASSLLKELRSELIDICDKKVLRVTPADVDRIELALKDKATRAEQVAELRREAGAWRMVKPLSGKANADAVFRMLSKAESLSAYLLPRETVSDVVTELDKPQARVTLHMTARGQTATLLIGSPTKEPGGTYVKSVSNPAVFIVRTSELEPLLAEPPNYWDAQLVRLGWGADVTQLVLKRSDGIFAVESGKDGSWSLTEPLKVAADANNVARIVEALRDLSATKIVAVGAKLPARYAEANDVIDVTLSAAVEPPLPETPATTPATTQSSTQPASASAPPAAPAATTASAPATGPATAPASQPASQPASRKVKETHHLRFAKIGEKAYGWVVGKEAVAVGEVPMSTYDALAAELRDRTLLSAKPDEVEGIKITAGGETLELRRDGDSWRCDSHRHVKIDPAKVKQYLEDLRQAQGEKFASQTSDDWTRFGVDSPAVTIELTVTKGAAVRVFISKTGPEKTKDRYAGLAGVEGVLILSGQTYDKIAKALKDFQQ